MTRGPMSPQEYGGGLSDDELDAAGYAVGLDVWAQIEKAYSSYIGNGTLANSQLWSLREAVRAEVLSERPAGPVYLVVIEERHSGVDAYPFSTSEAAIEYAQATATEYADYPDDVTEGVMTGCLYSAKWSEEGDYAWVVEREMDATP